MPLLFLIFLIVPLVEIYLLIEIGSVIGAPWTIFFVVFTAVVGAALVRAQGFATFTRFQSNLSNNELPAMELLEGLFLLVAGALLLTPGFFTDAIGFACLTPPLRRWMIVRLLKRFTVASGTRPTDPRQPRRPLPGEFRNLDD